MKIIKYTFLVILFSSIFNCLSAQSTSTKRIQHEDQPSSVVVTKSNTKKTDGDIVTTKRKQKVKNQKEEKPLNVDSTNLISSKKLLPEHK